MNDYEKTILNKLLDKYEARLNGSNRRVLISLERHSEVAPDIESHEYIDFKESMEKLRDNGIIELDWVRKNYIINSIWLVIENAPMAYKMLGREDKESKIHRVVKMISSAIDETECGWIKEYFESEKNHIIGSEKITGIWKLNECLISAILKSLTSISHFNGKSISMRVFSINTYGDSKFFENKVKDRLIPIIHSHEPFLMDIDDVGDREVLAHVGIIMMPEIFEFCGNVKIYFQTGAVDFSPIKSGACISGDSVSEIVQTEILNTDKIIFIENKTNYSDYCLSHRSDNELVIFHGGFLSPQRTRFFKLLCSEKKISSYFWGDIDYGGFKMFVRLKRTVVPELMPLNMDIESFEAHKDIGLKKNDEYLNKLIKLKNDKDYTVFYEVIDAISRYKITVEQESFINYFSKDKILNKAKLIEDLQ